MLKLLLVDDEQPILDGLKVLIDWEKHGIGRVEFAGNGQEALDKALKLLPDIVLTDIRMPVMSGLELIKLLKAKLPKAKYIILSGYQEFEYAKEAMRFGALGYLLKPVDENELADLLKSAVEACLLDSRQRDNLASLNKKLNESSAYIRNKILFSIAVGDVSEFNAVRDKLEYCNIGKLPDRYVCIVIDLEHIGEKYVFSANDTDLIRFAAANITDEIINGKSSGQVFYPADSQISALFEVKEGMDYLIEPTLRDILARVKDFIKIPATIGVSNIHTGFNGIAPSFREARSALKYKLLAEKGRILNYKDVVIEGIKAFNITVKIEKKLVNCILCGDTESISGMVHELFSEFRENRTNPDDIAAECREMLLLVKHSVNITGNIMGIISDLCKRFRAEANNYTVDGLKNYLISVLEEAALEVSKSNYSGTRELITQIKEYISKNYPSQITLNTISEKFYFNSSYVSRLFKKELTENFIDYLTGIRIEEAKKLLAGTDLKVYEISERIGYNNSKYFTQLFEKMQGMSPRKYRELNKKS